MHINKISIILTEFEYYDTPQVGESDTPSKRIPHLKTSAQTPQDKVFEYCRTLKSIREIAAMLGVKDTKWTRKKYVAPFLETRLRMTIPDKPNSQNQKYQTIE